MSGNVRKPGGAANGDGRPGAARDGRIGPPVSRNGWDVIVVGAGLAGLAAASTLARGGARVLVLERGDYPGAKNLIGGVLYHRPTEAVFPGFDRDAPLERQVVRQELWLTTADGAVSVGYTGGRWREEPNAWTALRARLDPWLAERVRREGALLVTQVTVTGLLRQDGRVVGVSTSRPGGDVGAPLVIVAEGANRLLVEGAGLAEPLRPREVVLGVKEVIALPREVIESRFRLRGKEGATVELVGEVTGGLIGSGFVYTNGESLSVGLGVALHQLVEAKLNPLQALERLKAHPLVRPLLEGGEVKEYAAHLIPEGGYRSLPRLYGDGVLVAGDAAHLCVSVHREGSNHALVSGRLAAETALEALDRGDFSERFLARYRERLHSSFVLQDLKKYENVNDFFERTPQLFGLYPRLLAAAAEEIGTVDLTPKREKQRRLWRLIRSARPPLALARDLYRAWRALG